MFNRIVFWRAAGCYNSALAILEAMEKQVGHRDILIRKLENSKLRIREDDYIINWGNGGFATWGEASLDAKTLINHPNNVNIAVNKIKTFRALDVAGVQTLKWTTSRGDATLWYNEGHTVIGRKTISGCCGEGIVIMERLEGGRQLMMVSDCPLYTLYQKKRHEYRVHVFGGKVIDVVQKKKKAGSASPTLNKIRNVDDGWAFCHKDLQIKDVNRLNQIGIDAVKACGLHFGAVDVIWNEKQDKYYVVEVNTAPGLETSTIQAYANAFLEDIKNG